MKLSAVYFDDTVCIPGGKDTGGGVRHDLRDSSFQAADGWDIEMHTDTGGVFFRLRREGMTATAFVGGYGYTYVQAPMDPPEPEDITPVRIVDRDELAAEYAKPKRSRKR